jgi:hypothetical protein
VDIGVVTLDTVAKGEHGRPLGDMIVVVEDTLSADIFGTVFEAMLCLSPKTSGLAEACFRMMSSMLREELLLEIGVRVLTGVSCSCAAMSRNSWMVGSKPDSP